MIPLVASYTPSWYHLGFLANLKKAMQGRMKRKRVFLPMFLALAVSGAFVSLLQMRAQSKQATPVLNEYAEVLQPQIGSSVKFDISPPLREMTPLAPHRTPYIAMPSPVPLNPPPDPFAQTAVFDPVASELSRSASNGYRRAQL